MPKVLGWAVERVELQAVVDVDDVAEVVNGRFHTMRTTIDGAGRLVIPKPIRDRLGLHGNEQVEITERDGRIEIEPAPTHVELVREGAILVARPDRAMPQLTDDVVRETLDRIRR